MLSCDFIGGVYMKKKYDIAIALILLLLLVIGYFVGNAVIRGIILFVFSAALIINTILKLRAKMDGRFGVKFFYGILLFLEGILAIAAFYVTVTAIVGV